jgi:hypothetical protein
MDPPPKSAQAQTSLFQVYLRLRPPIIQTQDPQVQRPERYLAVESPSLQNVDSESSKETASVPTRITLHPPNDSRKRAVEKFAFTKVFEENASQLDIFNGTGMVPLINGVLSEGRDGLAATLGVTGSGKV